VKGTVPHEMISRYGASRVLLKPASEGTGIIAGGTARAIFEVAGIENILCKSLGSNTPCNVVKATINGLKAMRTINQAAALRGKTVAELTGKEANKFAEAQAESYTTHERSNPQTEEPEEEQ